MQAVKLVTYEDVLVCHLDVEDIPRVGDRILLAGIGLWSVTRRLLRSGVVDGRQTVCDVTLFVEKIAEGGDCRRSPWV